MLTTEMVYLGQALRIPLRQDVFSGVSYPVHRVHFSIVYIVKARNVPIRGPHDRESSQCDLNCCTIPVALPSPPPNLLQFFPLLFPALSFLFLTLPPTSHTFLR